LKKGDIGGFFNIEQLLENNKKMQSAHDCHSEGEARGNLYKMITIHPSTGSG
jgi:hypothetical protein